MNLHELFKWGTDTEGSAGEMQREVRLVAVLEMDPARARLHSARRYRALGHRCHPGGSEAGSLWVLVRARTGLAGGPMSPASICSQTVSAECSRAKQEASISLTSQTWHQP